MDDHIFYDLERMTQRAYWELQLQTTDPIALGEFIDECRAFQFDILRPWDRTD